MLLNCGAGEKLLRVPQTARRSSQSILKEINPEFTGRTDAEAEAPILCHLMQRANSLEKNLNVGKSGELTGKDSDTGKDRLQEERGGD